MVTAKAPAAKAPRVRVVKIPKDLAVCADRCYELRALIADRKKAMEAELADLVNEFKVLQEHLINTLPKSQSTGVSGVLATAKITTDQVPTVEDWDKLYAFIKKTGSFDLLGRSLSATAVKERWDAKKAVPGVGTFNVVKLSLVKV